MEAHREEKCLSTVVCSASKKGSWDFVGTHSRSVEMNDPFYGAEGLPGEFPFLQLFCAASASQICQMAPSLTEKDHLFDQKVCKMDIALLFTPSAYNGYFWNLNMSAPKNPFFSPSFPLVFSSKYPKAYNLKTTMSPAVTDLAREARSNCMMGYLLVLKKKISKEIKKNSHRTPRWKGTSLCVKHIP